MENFLIKFNEQNGDQAEIDDRCEQWLGYTYLNLLPAVGQMIPDVFPYITSLNISGCGIDKFPYVLKACKCIQDLNVSKNQLSVLPALFIVYYFPYLKVLDVSDNQLSLIDPLFQLGCLPDLEVFNCFGNPLPKVDARIELLEALFFSAVQSLERYRELGAAHNGMSVFLCLGSASGVFEHFQENMAEAVKANQWLQDHELRDLAPKRYAMVEPACEQYQLTNGSMFQPLDTGTDIFVRGPGFSLQKDERLEAPIVIIGRVPGNIACQGISTATRREMHEASKQIDTLLSAIDQNELVSERIVKFGFFGKQYFVYQHPFRLEQRHEHANKNKISTREFIAKTLTKDIRISTNIPQTKLEELGLDVQTMLPSEIEKIVIKSMGKSRYFVNMNQRALGQTKQFPRLRVLNGHVITFEDFDKAQQLFRHKKELKSASDAAVLMHCKTKIPPLLKQSIKQLEKQANMQESQRSGDPSISVSRPFSELIKKKQIYQRLVQLSKKEKEEAIEAMRRFLVDGELTASDDGLKFAELLDSYDKDKDMDINEFMLQCRTFCEKFAAEEEANDLLVDQSSTVISVMNGSMSSKPRGPFTPKGLASEEQDAPQGVKKLGQRAVSMIGGPKKQIHIKVGEVLTENDLALSLALQTPSLAMKNSQRFSQASFDELERSQGEAPVLNESQTASSPQLASSTRIGQALEVSVLETEAFSKLQQQKAANKQNCSVRAPGMNTTMQMNLDALLLAKSGMEYSTDPHRLIKQSLATYDAGEQFVPTVAEKSRIMKEPFRPNAQTLDLSKVASLEEYKTVAVPQELKNIEKMPRTKEHPDRLFPDFHMIMQSELQQQRKETQELMVHVARNIDQGVRRGLRSPDNHFAVKENQMRHSALLDVVLEGDRISGNPNAMNLQSQYIGPIEFQKMNEAQEIIRRKAEITPQPRKIARSPNRVLQHTSEEIMQFIDNQLQSAELRFEQQTIEKKMSQNHQNADADMRALIRQNNEEIERAHQREMREEHKGNLALIAKEPALMELSRPSPALLSYATETRKLQRLQKKTQQQQTQNEQTYVNEQMRYGQIVDRSAIAPIPVRSPELQQKYHTDTIQVLNVPSLEEVAAEASTMRIEATDLIQQSSYIMRNAKKEIADLQRSQQEFMERQKRLDEIRTDPMNTLMQAKFEMPQPQQTQGYERIQVADLSSPFVKAHKQLLDKTGSDERQQIKSAFEEAVNLGVSQLQRLQQSQ